MRLLGLITLVACGGGAEETDALPPQINPTDTDTGLSSNATDGDNDAASATPLSLTEEPESSGVIDPAGDIDWWVYTAAAPEWVDVRTIADNDLNTVLRVWAEDGTEYAAIDNYATGLASGYDSILRLYLPSAGDWFITVEDVTTYYTDLFTEEEWAGGADYAYELWIQSYDSVLDESDAIDDPSGEVVLPDGNTIFSLGFVVDAPGDSDWVSVELPVGGEPLEVWAQPANYGSTLDLRVRLYDASGALLADRSDVGPDGYLSFFEPAAGTYTVEATDEGGAGDAGAWGVLYIRTYEPDGFHPFFADNLYTPEVEPNDDLSVASGVGTLPEETDDGFAYDAGRFAGDLLVTGDVDFFSFAAERAFLSARCFTEGFGSLALLSVRAYDPGGLDVTPIGQGDVAVGDYWLYNVPVSPTGDWTLSVGSLDGVFGPQSYYRCASYLSDETIAVE